MDNEKSQKIAKQFSCEKCNYTCCNKYDYNKHLTTAKHLKDNKDNKKIATREKPFSCIICNKLFAYNSGLSRHTKKFHTNEEGITIGISQKSENYQHNESTEDVKVTQKMFHEMLEQNQYLQQQLMELSKQGRQTFNYTDNKKMTINIFLNEKCKDAMNLTDFMNNLQITLDDLMYTKNHGYAKGVSNIFLKHLGHLKPTERPIHCSDRKRLQFYVKDEDKWEKDNNEKIDKTIHHVSQKQIRLIKEWESKHPNWAQNDEETGMYLKMIQEVMGGVKEEDVSKNKEIIKKTISSVFDLKDAMIE